MNNTLDKLVGAQLVSLDSGKMTVTKHGKQYLIYFSEDQGDCCGFAILDAKLFISDENQTHNPIITNVEVKAENSYGSSMHNITFFGGDKKLAEINTDTGSGSGWDYGACVIISCERLGINECFCHR